MGTNDDTLRESPTDEALLTRYAAGDTAAFAALVRRHEAGVYNFVLRQVRSPAAAEDIVQDVFVRVVQSVGEFRGVYTSLQEAHLPFDAIDTAKLNRVRTAIFFSMISPEFLIQR